MAHRDHVLHSQAQPAPRAKQECLDRAGGHAERTGDNVDGYVLAVIERDRGTFSGRQRGHCRPHAPVFFVGNELLQCGCRPLGLSCVVYGGAFTTDDASMPPQP